MDRTERVREVVDEMLRQQPGEEERRCGFVHLYGVAQACALLALKRGLDPELCTVAGMLHDIWSYKTLPSPAAQAGSTLPRDAGGASATLRRLGDHARLGAPLARTILADLGCFAADEIETICHAIAHHSDKAGVHGPYDELLKDADVLQHYLYNALFPPIEKERTRLPVVLAELGLDAT